MRLAKVVIVSLVLSGCSMSEPLGIRPGSLGMTNLVEYGALPDSQGNNDDQEGSAVTRLIVVGRAAKFQKILPEDVKDVYERQYLTYYKTWGSEREPSLGLEQFADTIGGFAEIQMWRVSAILISVWEARYTLVPSGLSDDVYFPGALDTAFWTGTGDLIAARTNDDGVLIVEKVLCKEGQGFGDCANDYQKGTFDAATGRKLDWDLESTEDEVVVDPISFKIVKQNGALISNQQIE